jgi:hypothetical protein
MRWKGWEKVPLDVPDLGVPGGIRTVKAVAPVIVSASRSTDIPAFYGDWFMSRVRDGRVTWKSPFGGDPVHVSFARTRLFVFWSKDPAPFLPHLKALDRSGYRYYFLFTLNDYEGEGLEPHVPPLDDRIGTFIQLSQRIGKGRVVWRFDPLVLSDRITVDNLLAKVQRIGDKIAPFTDRLVFSFVDIALYKKVQRNLLTSGCSGAREFTDPEVREFCCGLAEFNRKWGLELSACAENRDLLPYGIGRGQCISYDLMVREFADDPALMEFLRPGSQSCLDGTVIHANPEKYLKDPGQRSTCRCIVSRDIGQYSTCPHLCSYCYANTSREVVCRNYSRYREARDRGIFFDSITG